LVVKITRRKSKKTLTTNLEVFRMRERDVPVDSIDIADPTSTPLSVSWEPRGRSFSIIHSSNDSDDSAAKHSVSFYKVLKKGTSLMFTLDRVCERVHWSPANSVVVLTTPNNLEFYDVKNNLRLAECEHFKCSSVQWDPSGRFCASVAGQPFSDQPWAYSAESGYKIWSFQGDVLASVLKDSLYQFIWRPRPVSLLSPQEKGDVKRNLRTKYWAQFEQEQNKIKQGNQSAAVTLRKQLADDWRRFLKECVVYYRQEVADFPDGGHDLMDENDFSMVDTTVQELISITETPVGNTSLLFD